MPFFTRVPQILHAGLLVLSRASYLVSSFVLFLLLVRLLPVKELDRLSVAFAWQAVLLTAFDFGINEYMVRAVNGRGKDAPRHLAESLAAKGLLILAVCLVYIPAVGILYSGDGSFPALVFAAVAGAARSLCDFAESALIARGETRAVFRFASIQAVAAFCAGILAARFVVASAAMVLASQMVVYTVLGVSRLQTIRAFDWNVGGFQGVLRRAPALILAAVPFGAIVVGSSLMSSAPLIVMSFESRLSGTLATFTAAQRIWGTLLSFGQGPFTRLYAVFSEQEAAGRHQESQRLARRMVFPLGALGMAIILGTVLCGEPLLRLLYTAKLSGAYADFSVLAASLPFTLVAYIPGAWLPAKHHEREKMIVVIVFCSISWLGLLLLRHRLTGPVCTVYFSTIWILQSLAFWALARFRSRLEIGWLSPNLLPVAGLLVLFAGMSHGLWWKWAGLVFGGLVLAAQTALYRSRLSKYTSAHPVAVA